MGTISSGPLTWVAQAITFYEPSYWGFSNDEELLTYSQGNPREFFDRLTEAVSTTNVEAIELCMAPGDWKTARAAYETPDGLKHHLQKKKLRLTGSYQSGWVLDAALEDSRLRREVLDDAARHAEFIREAGADLMLTGPTRRGNLEGSIVPRVSDETIERTAEIVSAMAERVAAQGVKLAIHTEAYSVVCREEDISRMMQATDPNLVGLCPDTGHIALDGGKTSNVIRRHSDRILSMHWKDCIGPRANLPVKGTVTHEEMMEQFRRMGKGIVDWAAIAHELKAANFRGYAVAEIDLSPTPEAEVQDILTYYRTELAPILESTQAPRPEELS